MPAYAWVDERDEDVELAKGAQDADQRLEVFHLPVFHTLYGGNGDTALVCQLNLRHVLLQAYCFYFGCNPVAKLDVCQYVYIVQHVKFDIYRNKYKNKSS